MSTQEKQKASQILYGVEPYQETKGEEYMGEPMRKHFTKILNAWKQELMVGVDKTVDHMKEEAANFADPADRASQEEEFALELRARDRERKLIKKIDKTLQLIQDEEYGWCEDCGIPIGLRRLEARPTADLCFDCKEVAEKKEKQVGKA
ncbi:MAG TPA: RNA polymerase-binding protein DksA [Pseudomonas sp.]|uniref:RNA polymerase-binding protein DksA n=1 Tax=Pseudomonas sp. TaxID=306 RepID=UPI002B48C798|nr:RNA polymerase-binding protein DksA [Pseudomonas sp.]HKS13804.1 RNA polymerase-binding protein DksA [Pseudomonas sp.]